MKTASDGAPECAPSRRGLGVVAPGDIAPDDAGQVQPGSGGMSVSPDGVDNLPQHRRPPSHGGTGKDSVFVIGSFTLGLSLKYCPDPENPKHGWVEPAQRQTLTRYQHALCQTRTDWTIV